MARHFLEDFLLRQRKESIESAIAGRDEEVEFFFDDLKNNNNNEEGRELNSLDNLGCIELRVSRIQKLREKVLPKEEARNHI